MIKSEFEKYATGHLNVSSMALHDYQNSMTPYILEEREKENGENDGRENEKI